MAHISVDIQNLYKTYFGGNYVIPNDFKVGEGWDNYSDGLNNGGLTAKYQGRIIYTKLPLLTVGFVRLILI